MNLFCFPFAGGNALSYRGLQQSTADFINIVAIDLPGHGKKLREPLLTNIHDMAEYLFQHIKDTLIRQSFAIYGHSMGAILGYLVSQKVVREKMRTPLHLFVSGRQGPSGESKEKNWHLLPTEEFLKNVISYGGIPQEVIAEKELLDLFVPILRADFQAHSEYLYDNGTPLDVPVTAMLGIEEHIRYHEALQWQEVSFQKISIEQFPGNHFFIFDHLAEIGSMISQTLVKALSENTNKGR